MNARNKTIEAEISHGKWLVAHDPEIQWGWGTPAGKLRASRRADLIISAAGIKPGMKVMEIGCGIGNFTERFLSAGCEIVAIDISQDLIKVAMGKGLPADRVTFIASPFEECAKLGPFDAVIGSSVLHHLDRDRTFRKIFELLKPGGRMSFAEPNMLNPQVFFMLKARFLFPKVSPDETAFFEWDAKRLMLDAGFQDVSVVPFDWLHPSTPKKCIAMVKAVEALVESTPMVKKLAGSLAMSGRKPL